MGCLLCLPIFPITHQMPLSMVVPFCFFSCANYQWTMKNLLKIFTKQIQTQINKKAYRHRHHCRFCRCSHKQLLLIFNIHFQIKKRKTDFLQDNWEFLLFFPRKLSNARQKGVIVGSIDHHAGVFRPPKMMPTFHTKKRSVELNFIVNRPRAEGLKYISVAQATCRSNKDVLANVPIFP